MDDSFHFVSVPFIVSAVYGIMALWKNAIKDKAKAVKFVPLKAAVLGAVLGVLIFFVMPDFMPASSWHVALLIGASSGLAATGTHQVFKQMTVKCGDGTSVTIEGSGNKSDDGGADSGAAAGVESSGVAAEETDSVN